MPICIAKVRPEPQRAANETVTASLAGCKADAAFGNMRHKLLACPVVASGNRDPLLPPACSRARWALGDDNIVRVVGIWRQPDNGVSIACATRKSPFRCSPKSAASMARTAVSPGRSAASWWREWPPPQVEAWLHAGSNSRPKAAQPRGLPIRRSVRKEAVAVRGE